MTAPPADFGDFVIGCGPAIVMTIFVLSAILALVSALRLLAWGIRWWRDGEWQLARAQRLAAIDQAMRTPVTRPMSAAVQDAIHGPKLGELTGPDHVVTGQLAAVQDALTPRMVAPTRADLIATCGFCHDIAVMGDAAECRCKKPCGVKWCSALRRQVPRG